MDNFDSFKVFPKNIIAISILLITGLNLKKELKDQY
jgi:hypothetical protein